MSPDTLPRYDANVASVRLLYRALAAGDRETLGKLLHPDFIGHATEGLPFAAGGEHVGPDAMRREVWWQLGRHYRVEAFADNFHALDDGRLLVTGYYRGEGRRSGKKLDAAFHHVIGFGEDGRLTSLDQLTDTAAWIEALDEPTPLHAIDYSVVEGLATICLNRPASRNAIDPRMADESLVVARRIADDRSVRAVLIWGNGPSFSVGGDIDSFPSDGSTPYGELLERMTTPFHEAFRVLSRIDAPIVTAVHGAVAGGGLGYVYAADLVLAAEDTRFVTAFAALGLSGDAGGTWHLPRLIGARRATQAYLRNTPIGTAEALEWGLINEIVPAEELRARALALATELAQGPTRAYARMRALMRDAWQNDMATQLQSEIEALKATADTADAAEALSAFRAGRAPRFTGR
jgi:2-(1,2-epoxy-1,2-dihydrophenyl)acetyl-CoA isomerase